MIDSAYQTRRDKFVTLFNFFLFLFVSFNLFVFVTTLKSGCFFSIILLILDLYFLFHCQLFKSLLFL